MKKTPKNCLAVFVTACLLVTMIFMQGCKTTNYGEPVRTIKKILNIEVEFKKDLTDNELEMAFTEIDKQLISSLMEAKIRCLEITIKHIPLPNSNRSKFRIEVDVKVPVSTGAVKAPIVGPKPPKMIEFKTDLKDIIEKISQLDIYNKFLFEIKFQYSK